MKGILKQLGQCISKYKKSLIYGVFALFIGQAFLFNIGGMGVQSQVYAADDATKTASQSFKETATEWVQDISFLKQVIYVVLWPCLWLAGKLVDNSFVYGSIFGFDAVLWSLWNVVKNLANFGLGFLFVFKICKLIIDRKQDDTGEVKKILKSALIAGIGIQASWFIMAALLDVSTILTYGLGGLPLSLLEDLQKEETKDGKPGYDPYILKTSVTYDTNDPDAINFYLTDPAQQDLYISQCRSFTYKIDKTGDKRESFLLAPSTLYYRKCEDNCTVTTSTKTQMDKCTYMGGVYYFAGDVSAIWSDEIPECTLQSDTQDAYNEYLSCLATALNSGSVSNITNYLQNGKLLQVGNIHEIGGVKSEIWSGPSDGNFGLDVDNNKVATDNTKRLSEILKGTEGYVGVFSTLYSSLLNGMSKFSETGNSIYHTLLNTLLSCGHMIAIGIPLIAMVVVFFMRIIVLRLAIALSPVIVLITAFGFEKDVFKDDTLKHFKIENLLKIIFSPAIMCFMVSLSTVIVYIIQTVNKTEIEKELTPILGGLIEIRISGLGISLGELLISIMGVVVTWFLVWAAVQWSSLGESKVIKDMKDLATTTLGSVPIVPIVGRDGGVSFVGTTAAGNAIDNITNQITTKTSSRDTEAINQLFTSDAEKAEKLESQQQKSYVDGFAKVSLGDWSNWTSTLQVKGVGGRQMTFNDLSDANKLQVIDKINGLSDEARRDKFGTITELHIGNDVYKYNNQNDVHKYEKQGGTSETKPQGTSNT